MKVKTFVDFFQKKTRLRLLLRRVLRFLDALMGGGLFLSNGVQKSTNDWSVPSLQLILIAA